MADWQKDAFETAMAIAKTITRVAARDIYGSLTKEQREALGIVEHDLGESEEKQKPLVPTALTNLLPDRVVKEELGDLEERLAKQHLTRWQHRWVVWCFIAVLVFNSARHKLQMLWKRR